MSEMTGASPLAEIERNVQLRAKRLALDMGRDEGRQRLRALAVEEVAAWSADHKRGLRAFDLTDPDLVVERALRNLAGYGPLESLLADDDVWEIMINAPDLVFVKRHRGRSGYHDEVFHDDEHVRRTLTKILDDASGAHRKLDPADGLQDAQLDNGARLHIVHGDIGRDGHILVNIRKFTGVAFRSLKELVDRGMLDQPVAEFLRACVRARLSIVFAGAPGSGKTTMLSCCAAELDPSLRVVVAEEVFEADIPLSITGIGLSKRVRCCPWPHPRSTSTPARALCASGSTRACRRTATAPRRLPSARSATAASGPPRAATSSWTRRTATTIGPRSSAGSTGSTSSAC